jgi:hypothetical protein
LTTKRALEHQARAASIRYGFSLYYFVDGRYRELLIGA